MIGEIREEPEVSTDTQEVASSSEDSLEGEYSEFSDLEY